MSAIDQKIIDFIESHHVLTLAVAKDNIPYCSHCFYCYLPDRNFFVFTSDPDTRHIRDVESSGNYHVTAGIALETKITGKIRGLQITGMLALPGEQEMKIVRKAYIKRFPVSGLAKLHLWILRPGFMKLTDNRLGFGTKLIWENI